MSRTRGSGGLFRQKTSSIWWIKYYKNGKPYRESTGTSNKTKAGRRLGESETLELLRRSMGRSITDHYWERMLRSLPHPNDVHEGEQ